MNPFENHLSTLGENVVGWTVLSFKWNICEIDASLNLISRLYDYALCCNPDQDALCFATAGEHREGKHEIPHIHLNVALSNFKSCSNESRRREKYLLDIWDIVLPKKALSCSIKAIATIRDLENTLKYAWKEDLPLGIESKSRYIFPEDVRLYLIQSGQALFEASKDDSRKKERASAQAKTLQGQIMDIIKGKEFQTYTEFKVYVCAEVYRPLAISEYPATNFLRSQIQNVAINTGVVPPHFFI